MSEMKNFVSHKQASQLLHNKFVVVLGDSIQRAVYKDLVLLLQKEKFLTRKQLRTKGEMSFEQDCLVEGGCLNELHNGTAYREVRQFQTDHHLVRFYFVTRVYSRYMESVLEDFRRSLKPDVVIINSCVWDISRYSRDWTVDYKENLHRFFEELKAVLPQETLVIWNLTMPLGEKIKGGFLVPEIEHMASQLRYDVIEANFFSGTLADAYKMDVVDLHFHFRFSLHHRTNDGVHWDNVAHRKITSVLLQHAADAWGVELTRPLDASEHSVEEIKLSTSFTISSAPKHAAVPMSLFASSPRPPLTAWHHSGHRELVFTDSRHLGDLRRHPGPRPYPPMHRHVPLPPPPPSTDYRLPYENRFFPSGNTVDDFQDLINRNDAPRYMRNAAPAPAQPYSPMNGHVPLPPPPSSSYRFPYKNWPVGDDFPSRPYGHFESYGQPVLRNRHTTKHHYAPYPPRRRDRYNYYY